MEKRKKNMSFVHFTLFPPLTNVEKSRVETNQNYGVVKIIVQLGMFK